MFLYDENIHFMYVGTYCVENTSLFANPLDKVSQTLFKNKNVNSFFLYAIECIYRIM